MIEPSVLTDSETEKLLSDRYSITNISKITLLPEGSANCRIINTANSAYFLKEFQSNFLLEQVIREAGLRERLKNHGLPVPQIILTTDGPSAFIHKGRVIQLQPFVEGEAYDQNKAPAWLIPCSISLLGDIAVALQDIAGFPMGFDKHWFAFDVNKKQEELESLSRIAVNHKCLPFDASLIKVDLEFKKALVEEVACFQFDLDKFSVGNTHGDYSIHQLICSDGRVNAIIDFASACSMPFVWEVIRSFTYADPESADGSINTQHLKDYVLRFHKKFPLLEYDLRNMARLYLYQLARSTYGYKQALTHESASSRKLLQFGRWRTAMCRFLRANVDSIENEIVKLM